jgi:hypothetical protein
MSSIIDSITSALNPDMIGGLAKALGTDGAAITKGLGAAGPLLLGSMAKMAGTPGGAESLLKMLPQESGGLGGLLSGLLGGGAAQTGGADMLSSLIGPGVNAVSASLSKALGFNVAPLLGAAAPAALGFVAKMVKEKSLDAGGLASALAKENDAFVADPANREAVALAAAAAEAGKQASATIAAYGPDWQKVVLGPAAALFAVATSDLSGPIGSIKEAQAASEALQEAAKRAAPTSVIAAAFAGGITPAMLKELKAAAPSKDKLIDLVKAGAAAVAAKSPGEAQAYKETLLAVAKATAEASKEGGFFGIGGTLVSKEEQAALDAIKAALG